MQGNVIVEFETKQIRGTPPRRIRRRYTSEQHSRFKDSIVTPSNGDSVTITAINGTYQCRKTYTDEMLARETLGVIPVNIHLLNLINNRAAPTVEFIDDIAIVTWYVKILGSEVVLSLTIGENIPIISPNSMSPELTYMTDVIESINSRVEELEEELHSIKILSPTTRPSAK